MRGDDPQQNAMFSHLSPEQRVPQDHPLRRLRPKVDAISLKSLSRRFDTLYGRGGRPSFPAEKLLRALLLQVLYTVRSERLLMEQLDYTLLFRWFVGLNLHDPVWDPSVFSKNRERLLAGDIAEAFFAQVLAQARENDWLSDEHFSVDGTLIEAWAGHKSFRKKGEVGAPPADDPGNPSVDFRGQKRRNQTHESTTDPQARLYKKKRRHEAKLGFLGHLLTENRNGLAVKTRLTLATGRAEPEAALQMLTPRQRRPRVTVATDKKYDTHDFVAAARFVGFATLAIHGVPLRGRGTTGIKKVDPFIGTFHGPLAKTQGLEMLNIFHTE